jgi:hypothetical protein
LIAWNAFCSNSWRKLSVTASDEFPMIMGLREPPRLSARSHHLFELRSLPGITLIGCTQEMHVYVNKTRRCHSRWVGPPPNVWSTHQSTVPK